MIATSLPIRLTQVEVHHLIDFMVVQCAMKSNNEKEEAYIRAFKKLRKPLTVQRERGMFVKGVQNMMQQNVVAAIAA